MSFTNTVSSIDVETEDYSLHEGSILGVEVPSYIIVTTYFPLDLKYREACFYPSGLIADAQIKNTPITIELFSDGQTRARYYPTPDEEDIILQDYSDFRHFFPKGDSQLNGTSTHIIDWDMNPWFDLYQPLTIKSFTEHLDNVNHDLVEALEALIEETSTWKPYLHLLSPDCQEETLIQAVLSNDYKAREAALMNPNKPDTIFIADALNP